MSENSSEQAPKIPKPGDEVSGMKIVDPIAGVEEIRTSTPELDGAKSAPKSKSGKANKGKVTPSAETVRGEIEQLLNDKDLIVEVISADEHPRGPVVAVKRLPDVTRPIAYIDSGDNSWERGTLSLNLYGFLDSGSMETLQAGIKSALGISDSAVSSFTRF